MVSPTDDALLSNWTRLSGVLSTLSSTWSEHWRTSGDRRSRSLPTPSEDDRIEISRDFRKSCTSSARFMTSWRWGGSSTTSRHADLDRRGSKYGLQVSLLIPISVIVKNWKVCYLGIKILNGFSVIIYRDKRNVTFYCLVSQEENFKIKYFNLMIPQMRC